jgi:protein arginine kinase activator
MLCENCNERPATFHVVELTDGEKREVHLCEQCAHDKKIALPPSLSLNEILSSLVEANVEQEGEAPALECPNCGMTYAQFRRTGRLGCPKDYAVFRDGLMPFLERVHGATAHVGKSPAAAQDSERAAEMLRLRRSLNDAVQNERYEEAAELRDQMRAIRQD